MYAKKRPYTKKYSKTAPTNRRKLVSLIKRTVLKKAESKEKTVAYDKKEVYHNSFHGGPAEGLVILMNSGSMPTQGVSDSQRVGDEIYSSGYKIKLLFGQKADRPNVTFRYLVVTVPKGSTITYANWFKNITGNVLLDDPNRDFVKVHASGFWRPNEAGLANTGGDEYTFVKQMWVPYKKKVRFGPGDGVITHNDDDLYLVVMAYDAFGTLQADNIAYIQTALSYYYRDP
jgi:hypothetical protein